MLFKKHEPLPLWSIASETVHYVQLEVRRGYATLEDMECARAFGMRVQFIDVNHAAGMIWLVCEKLDGAAPRELVKSQNSALGTAVAS